MDTVGSLFLSLFKCNDPSTVSVPPQSSDVSLPDQIALEVTVYEKLSLNPNEVQDSSFDILQWWFNYRSTFPHLCTIVKDSLCVPASSTASERTFSTAGNIVTKTRNRLLPENINMLTFLRKNYLYIPEDTLVLTEDMETDSE